MTDPVPRLNAAIEGHYRIEREIDVTPDLTRFVSNATEAHADAWQVETGTEGFP